MYSRFAVIFCLCYVSVAAPVEKRQTIYAPDPSLSLQSGEGQSFSLLSSDGSTYYYEVAQSAQSGSFGPAFDITATLVEAPNYFSYYQSDSINGAAYQICSASGSGASAECVISVPEYSLVSTFDVSYGPLTTLNAAATSTQASETGAISAPIATPTA